MSTVTILKNTDVNREVFLMRNGFGMKVYVIPDKKLNKKEIRLVVRYGGNDLMYKDRITGDIKKLPEGIAHYIEHLTFNEEKSSYDELFKIYDKLNCEVNAYTNVNETTYEVDVYGTEYINPLRKLLSFVLKPYYTKAGIEKERGIISSEIEIRQAFTNINNVMFANSFKSSSVIGTKKSISTITEDMINNVYENYYTLNNMALIVSGDVLPGEVFNEVDKMLTKLNVVYKPKVERIFKEQEKNTNNILKGNYNKIKEPYMQFGAKVEKIDKREKIKLRVAAKILDIIYFSKMSEFSYDLFENRVIDKIPVFNYYDYYDAFVITCFTNSPFKLKKFLTQYLYDIKDKKISKEEFEIAKKALYGRNIRLYNKKLSDIVIKNFLLDEIPFSELDVLSTMSIENYKKYVKILLENIDENYMYYQR